MLASRLMMAAREVGLGAYAAGSADPSSTLTIARPDGVAAGTLLLAFVQGGSPTPPVGWSLLGSYSGRSVYHCVAGASEPASYRWTYGSSTRAQGYIVALSSAQIDVLGSFAAGQPPTAPAVTASAAGSIALAFFGEDNDDIAFSTPSGWTPIASGSGSDATSAALFYKRVNAGSTGGATSNPSPSTACVGVQLVVKPQ